MKILITGTSGVGKTTLGMALANKYSIDFIPEEWSDLLKKLKDFKEEKNVDVKGEKLQAFTLEMNQWINYRNKISDEKSSFVMDRSIFDILRIAVHEPLFKDQPKAIIKLIQKAVSFSRKVDCMVILPLNSYMNKQLKNEVGLIRNSNFQHKVYSQSLAVGLVEMYFKNPKIYIDPSFKEVDDKVQQIEKALNIR